MFDIDSIILQKKDLLTPITRIIITLNHFHFFIFLPLSRLCQTLLLIIYGKNFNPPSQLFDTREYSLIYVIITPPN